MFFCVVCLIVSLALVGETHRDGFVPLVVVCTCSLLPVVKMGLSFGSKLPHALMDLNQSWVKDATWEPSYVDEVKGRGSLQMANLCKE